MLERSINDLLAEAVPVGHRVIDFIEWMKRERATLSRHHEVGKAMDTCSSVSVSSDASSKGRWRHESRHHCPPQEMLNAVKPPSAGPTGRCCTA
jgi:hypothetical protein